MKSSPTRKRFHAFVAFKCSAGCVWLAKKADRHWWRLRRPTMCCAVNFRIFSLIFYFNILFHDTNRFLETQCNLRINYNLPINDHIMFVGMSMSSIPTLPINSSILLRTLRDSYLYYILIIIHRLCSYNLRTSFKDINRIILEES